MIIEHPFRNAFTIGGHIYGTMRECSDNLLVPIPYVAHMLQSDAYPGCRYLTDAERFSYFQTLLVMKSADNA
jgi:hypothetical protein